jgi:hypothetical protein
MGLYERDRWDEPEPPAFTFGPLTRCRCGRFRFARDQRGRAICPRCIQQRKKRRRRVA